MTIVEFLLARIAEVEAMARAVVTEEPADNWPFDLDAKGPAAFAHIVRHDPARVLARCEADRRIAGEHHEYLGVCSHCVDPSGEHQREAWPCVTLRYLALPYADHPDYREEWRP